MKQEFALSITGLLIYRYEINDPWRDLDGNFYKPSFAIPETIGANSQKLIDNKNLIMHYFKIFNIERAAYRNNVKELLK